MYCTESSSTANQGRCFFLQRIIFQQFSSQRIITGLSRNVSALEELTLINRVIKYWTRGCMWLEFCYIKLQRRQYHQFSSVALSCLTLCDPMGCSLLKLMSIESVMPSNHLILCRPLLLPSIFPSIRVFSNESALFNKWPKYCSFSFSINPSNEYSALVFFRTDWFDLLAVQETL